MRDWRPARLSTKDSLLTAMAVINRTTLGIVLVSDDRSRLLGTVVDGDIRRAVLNGLSLDTCLERVMNVNPIMAVTDEAPEVYLNLMVSHEIQQIPLLDKAGEIIGLELLKDLQVKLAGGLKAVIMAGGLGTRLRPLTDAIPKPMLPMGDRPIMEHVVERLRESGIHEVVVSTHYKGEMIRDHFGDGSSLGVDIRYVNEEQRFGTIGGLRLMRAHLTEPFLVVNGDVLTSLDFSAMRAFHDQHQADMTVAVRRHGFLVPYGVVKVEGTSIVALDEKPTMPLLINAGIYLINPGMIDYIPDGRSFDATDLVAELIRNKRRVEAFPILEYWVDIGNPPDYERANADLQAGRIGKTSQ